MIYFINHSFFVIIKLSEYSEKSPGKLSEYSDNLPAVCEKIHIE